MKATNKVLCRHRSQIPSPRSFTPALTWSLPSTGNAQTFPPHLHFRCSLWILTCSSISTLIYTSQVYMASLPLPSSSEPPYISCQQTQWSEPDMFSHLLTLFCRALDHVGLWPLQGLQKVILYCPLHAEMEGWRITNTNSVPRNNASGSGCALWHQRLTKNDPSDEVGEMAQRRGQ